MIDYYTLIPNFKKLIPKFLDRKNSFAIVGNFKNCEHCIDVLKSLEKSGYQLTIVDPYNNAEAVANHFTSLSDLPKAPDVVCLTTTPEKTDELVKECLKLGIKKVWIEPGSESDEAVEFCSRYYIEAIYHHSIIKEMFNPTAEESFLKKYDI